MHTPLQHSPFEAQFEVARAQQTPFWQSAPMAHWPGDVHVLPGATGVQIPTQNPPQQSEFAVQDAVLPLQVANWQTLLMQA